MKPLMTVVPDEPEGSAEPRKVLMSETLFRALAAGPFEWGEPDAEGFYSPTLRDDSDWRANERLATVERIRERMEAEYTVHYGRGVCLSLLSQVLDEEAQRA